MKKLLFLGVVVIVSGLILIIFITNSIKNGQAINPPSFGVTFSRFDAQYMNLDWRETYRAILDDLAVKKIRLSAYWPDIEPQADIFDFSNLDWQIDEAEKRGAKIILAVGLRLPGWPECHLPDWANNLSDSVRQRKILNLIINVISRYKDRPAITAWQIENEPFLSRFGLCPTLDKDFFEEEISVAKTLDKRPLIISASGELSAWITEARYADILGITIYRTTWNKYFKYFYYPLPAFSYYLKGQLVKFLTGIDKIMVVELQAEPWTPSGELINTPLKEQYKTMNLKRFQEIINYAKGTGYQDFYFWGVEWWYWLKGRGDSSIWDEAKQIFR